MKNFNAGELRKNSKDEYQLVCIFCGGDENLHMFPHRKDGKVVGFVYSCCEVPDGLQFKLEEKP